jgi:xylulokinase
MAEHGYAPSRVRVTNGGAHSLLWRQVTSDVLGLPLELVAHHPGSSLGAAFIAGMGVGIFKEWGEIEKFIEINQVTQPNLENHKRYQALFTIYREVYEDLKETYPKLARAAVSE